MLFVKGLFSSLEFAYAQFPYTDLVGPQMHDPVWEAVARLELCGFRVMALVCDGLAAHHKLFFTCTILRLSQKISHTK